MANLTETYLIFLAGLGWMLVSWTTVPEVVGRRATWWLVAFALTNAFAAAVLTTMARHAVSLTKFAESKLALFVQLAMAGLLFELILHLGRAADVHRPRLRWLHLVAAPVALLIVAGHVSVARALTTGFVVALLLCAAREFRRIAPPGDPRRRGLGFAAAGFALLAGAEGFATFGNPLAGTLARTILAVVRATGPWLICVGATEALFALIGTRSYAGRVFLGCLALTPLFTPMITGRIMPRFEAGARDRAVRTAHAVTAEFDSAAIARLATGTATPADRASIETRLAAFRAWPIAPERAYVWTLRDGVVHPLAGASGELRRDTTAAELSATAPFLRTPLSDGWTNWLSANAPFPGTSPPLWLALEYRASDWSRLMTALSDSVYGGLATVAIFITVAIVLLWRRALENRRFATLRDTETASRAKSEFLSFLSHELRTPLQSILGRAELLARTPLAAGQQRHLETIDAQGQLLLRLVTDLLDLGTIEAGKLSLAPAPFSLRRALAACEDVARRQAEGKPVTVSVVLDPAVPDDLVADETRLRQILGNLLNNAVKFTPAGAVTLRVSRVPQPSALHPQPAALSPSTSLLQLPLHDERLAFAVHDTGPGLPPAQLDQLFTLFTRLDPGEGFRREGTGVGLALVRRLCTLMGGTVTAANRPEGGAVFTATLAFPLAPAGDATPSSRLPVAIAPALTPLRILVVDDNTAARELLTEALRDAGHTVAAAPDARTALASYAAHQPEVIVLDLNLPDLDGVEVARQIRALAAPARGPRIVGCSAEAFAATRTAALAAGMDAFLEKPVRLATLLSVVAPPPATTAPSFPPENGIAPAPDDVFGRLRATGQLARTRAIWVTEWPLLRAKLDAAVTAHEPAAVVRHTHYLRSTALLLGDPALADATRALADAAQAGDWPAACVCLEELTTRAADLR